jgi:hypothetical protein
MPHFLKNPGNRNRTHGQAQIVGPEVGKKESAHHPPIESCLLLSIADILFVSMRHRNQKRHPYGQGKLQTRLETGNCRAKKRDKTKNYFKTLILIRIQYFSAIVKVIFTI